MFILGSIATGCANAPTPPAGGIDLFVPEHSLTPQDGVPAGDVMGIMRRDGPCLTIELNAGERLVLLWPEGTTSSVTDDTVTIASLTGEVIARTGDAIHVGGGGYQPSDTTFVEGLIGESVPDACTLLDGYWLVSEVFVE